VFSWDLGTSQGLGIGERKTMLERPRKRCHTATQELTLPRQRQFGGGRGDVHMELLIRGSHFCKGTTEQNFEANIRQRLIRD
jgi:hypothetical protein